jgi:predicted kinase
VKKSYSLSDAEKLYACFKDLPEPVASPALVVVSGLPGTGKTYFSKKLSDRLLFVTLESDVLRRILNPIPDHSKSESARLFSAIHLICERLLKEGRSVIVDATNLTEKHRQYFYDISDRLGVKLILVHVEAPASIVKDRLDKRANDTGSNSDADWKVYRRMRHTVDKIKRKYYPVDTLMDYTSILDKIVEEIRSK